LKAELKEKRQKYIDNATKVEKFINNIEDSEIRQIFRFRHIDGLSWDDIAGEMYLSRQTVKRIYNKFMESKKLDEMDGASVL